MEVDPANRDTGLASARRSMRERAAWLQSQLPTIYLALLGGLQIVLLWMYRVRFGSVIAPAGGLLLLCLVMLLRRTGERWHLRIVLLLALITVTTFAPSVVAIEQRQHAGLTFESDSMAMDEVAIDRILHAHAIYGTDWSGTQVDGYAYEYGGIDLHYYAHFPLMVQAAVPVRIVSDLLHVPFDYRMVVLAFSLVALGAIYWLPIATRNRFIVAVATLLNPAISLAGWTGHDDMCYLAMLLVGLALAGRRHFLWAALAFGAAAALKPFAILMLPFVLVALWKRSPASASRRARLRAGLEACGLFAVPLLLSIGPFVVRDAAGFYRDTVTFPTTVLPLGGFGFSGLLVALRIVPIGAQFPLGPLELGAAIPALWLTLRAFAKRPTLGHFLMGYCIALFAFLFFARFFADNYLAILIGLALCIPSLLSVRVLPLAQEESLGLARDLGTSAA